jgi:uncharacterized SAM-binding protein YcdF (DUF218 family)
MRRWLWSVVVLAAVLVAALVGRTAARIRQQSLMDEARPAEVIVVLGAAEYRGKPSPVLRARLEHGLQLYRRGLAPRILTTGGAGGDPLFTEGDVGRAWLIRQGVPSESIIVEPEGESTAYSLTAVGEILRRMNLRSCIVVSDGYHIYRAKRMLESGGFTVYGSPRREAPQGATRLWWLCARQAVGSLLWDVGVRI